MGAERRRKPGWLWPKKAHNKGLKSEPFILEADQAARSSHEENSSEQVREGDLRVVGVRSLKWCRQEKRAPSLVALRKRKAVANLTGWA